MTTAADVAIRKFHASLNVSDLSRSVAFYQVLFGRQPAKHYQDYAKFELDDPPLVLSLSPSGAVGVGTLNHAGLRVCNSEELVEIQRRVEEAGYATTREEGVACCYALQTKFWISDPDRTLWEVYTFHEDLDHHGDGSVPEVKALAMDVPGEKVSWEHRIPAPIPDAIPHDTNSLEEVRLEGTINLSLESGALDRLIKDAWRALRPGGSLRIHGLGGDRPLTTSLPPLPGPAAVVERVPASNEPLDAMAKAGFVGIRFQTLSRAHFVIAGVPMREVILVGQKPGYRPKKATHQVVYLGPLAQVMDDFGNVFVRGQAVALNVHDWHALWKSVVAEHFHFFENSSLSMLQEGCCAS
jgi:catechol 2,3-dioxygenase-like lactoylglutathione lyase family enzyme